MSTSSDESNGSESLSRTIQEEYADFLKRNHPEVGVEPPIFHRVVPGKSHR